MTKEQHIYDKLMTEYRERKRWISEIAEEFKISYSNADTLTIALGFKRGKCETPVSFEDFCKDPHVRRVMALINDQWAGTSIDCNSRLKICEDYIWVFEHSAEILEVIKSSKDTFISLKETFNLSDYQVKKLLQFRFDMLTKQEYERYKDEVTKIKENMKKI